ncbi:uncharacterized protein PAC_06337 [Phialocephala subalpina]|uniref:Uncharacterized protein n=1 Tax=Phialocephala subalpina TaxID=576137 RepID=A0A1L7WUK9_9HELO|nr:uncharacterized protein PAC_06337 [Phialocephala subalpina]
MENTEVIDREMEYPKKHLDTSKETEEQQVSIITTTDKSRCYDWIVTLGTCQYAKDRSSFKTYHSIPEIIIGPTLGPKLAPGPTRIIGIGTIELEVRMNSQTDETSLITLYDVLHTPDAPCNGFNPMRKEITEGCGNHCEFDARGATSVTVRGFSDGEQIWYAEECFQGGPWMLILAGEPEGKTYLKAGQDYQSSMFIDPEDAKALGIRCGTLGG